MHMLAFFSHHLEVIGVYLICSIYNLFSNYTNLSAISGNLFSLHSLSAKLDTLDHIF